MEHDQTVCLRCGVPAGAERFCESCCSQFGSLTGSPAYTGTQSGHTVLFAAGAGDGVGAAGKPPAAVDIGSGPPAPEGLNIDARGEAHELDKISTGAVEGLSKTAQPPRVVARFEEVLTPAPSDADRALGAYRQADAAGDPQGSVNLGVLLEQRGDVDGALAAYRRADERGDVNGSFNLGCLLAETGDVPGALAALRRADERGDGAAASNLGVLLEREGDHEAALAAYRRADDRGDANGAFNLGLMLAARGDLTGAKAAYQRAARLGDPEVQERAARAEAELGLPDTAAALPAEAEAQAIEEAPTAQPSAAPPSPEAPDVAAPEVAAPKVDAPKVDAPEVAPSEVDPAWTPGTSRASWIPALCVLALMMPGRATASPGPMFTGSATGTVLALSGNSFTIQTAGPRVGVVNAMTAAADRITNHDYPYVYGGGHLQAGIASVGLAGRRHRRRVGFDCSGSVAAVLASGGLWPAAGGVPSDAGVIATLRGEGLIARGVGTGPVEVTLYDDPGFHIFMNIDGRFFGTSDGAGAGSPRGGAGWLDDGAPDAYSRAYKAYHFRRSALRGSTSSGHILSFQIGALQTAVGSVQLGDTVQVGYQETPSGALVATTLVFPGASSTSGTVTAVASDGSSFTIQTASGSSLTLSTTNDPSLVQGMNVGDSVQVTYTTNGTVSTARAVTDSGPAAPTTPSPNPTTGN